MGLMGSGINSDRGRSRDLRSPTPPLNRQNLDGMGYCLERGYERVFGMMAGGVTIQPLSHQGTKVRELLLKYPH